MTFESASKRKWNVEKFVNYNLLFPFLIKSIITLRDYFDDVAGRHLQGLLPNLRKPVDSGDCSSRLRPSTSHACHMWTYDMAKIKSRYDIGREFLDVWSRLVSYCHRSLFHRQEIKGVLTATRRSRLSVSQ